MYLCLLTRFFTKKPSTSFVKNTGIFIIAVILLLLAANSEKFVTAAAANQTAYSQIPASPAMSGSVRREYWLGVPGRSVADIPLLTAASGNDVLTSLEIPSDWADDYGSRIRGYIKAPATGAYTFWIAGDDNCELWLSTNAQPAQRKRIAWVGDWTNPREWTKFPNQKSLSVNLTANQNYYFEVLHKEGRFGDHLAIGWSKPGQPSGAPSEIVPGEVLSDYTMRAAGEQARSADEFIDSIGINIHLAYTEGIYGDYEGVVKPRLRELGVRHVRDGLEPRRFDMAEKFRDLYGTLGIRSLLISNPRHHDPAQARDFVKNVIGAEKVTAIEGINEPNLFFGNEDWKTIARSFQRQMYQTFKADQATAELPFIAPALVILDPEARAANEFGDLTAFADFGNVHNYYGGRNPETNGWGENGYGGLTFNFERVAAPVSGSKPVMSTETGWHNAAATASGHRYTPEHIVARYMPRLFLHQFNRGVARSYPYEFIDQGFDQTDLEQTHGLLRRDNTAKPAFTALKNLIGILNDRAANFTPGALDYNVSGNVANVQHTLLQKRDGTFYLVLWLGAQRWNPDTQVETNIAAQTVTLSLRRQIETVKTYLPVESAQPTGVFVSPSALTLQIADQPLILEIKPAIPRATISGAVTYGIALAEQPIKLISDAVLTTTGAESRTTATDAAGAYRFDNLAAGDYTVTPAKSNDVNGINSLDAARIRRYQLGLTSFTPNQLIAADVNRDNMVDWQDASLIQQYVISAGNNQNIGRWQFLPSRREYSGLSDERAGQDFQAVLLGEATGDWTPRNQARRGQLDAEHFDQQTARTPAFAPFAQSSKESRAVNSGTVSLPSRTIARSGRTVDIPIVISGFSKAVESFDFAVAFDPAVLQPVTNAANTAGSLSGAAGFSVVAGSPQNGQIIVSGAGGETIPANATGTLVTLRFLVVGNGAAPTDQTRLTFVPTTLNSEPIVINDGLTGVTPVNGQFIAISPTASSVGVSGKVLTRLNRGIRKAVVTITDEAGNARVTLTDFAGNYRFAEVLAGRNYIIAVSSAQHRFRDSPRVRYVAGDVTDFNFTADR